MRPVPLKRKAAPVHEGVLQTEEGATPIVTPSVNFEGQGIGLPGSNVGGVPPDTDGDVGPNHYMQVVNTSLAIFSKTGTLVMNPMPTQAAWTGFTGDCATTNDGDATVRYDHMADRWLISQFSFPNGPFGNGPFYQCVAISTSPDPTGTYNRYQFTLPALNDYPKVGLWPDAYYFTFNMFGNAGFQGGKVCALDRVKALAGDPSATTQCFDSGPNVGGLLASDVDGKTLPPAGAPNYVVALNSNTDLAYYQLHVDFATPANSTFTGPTLITVNSYTPLCDQTGSCVPQPGTAQQLDSLSDRAMNRFVYRRFADHESLLFSHSIVAGATGGVRWYELRTPSAPAIFQQGTFAPADGLYRWLPSIAMDGSGDIATVYTVASSAVSPSIRYTARVPSDAAGTFGQGEGKIVTGAGAETQLSRWGDYASINIDPADDCTFWATHEYTKTTGRTVWQTRVASFTLPSCSSFAIAANDAEHVTQGGTATYTINTTTTAGSPQSVSLATSNLPTGVTATLNPTSVQSGSTTMVMLTADASAPLGPTHYTISGTGTVSSQMVDIPLVVDPPAAPDAGTDANGGGGNGGGCCQSSDDSPLAPAILGLGVIVVIGRRRR